MKLQGLASAPSAFCSAADRCDLLILRREATQLPVFRDRLITSFAGGPHTSRPTCTHRSTRPKAWRCVAGPAPHLQALALSLGSPRALLCDRAGHYDLSLPVRTRCPQPCWLACRRPAAAAARRGHLPPPPSHLPWLTGPPAADEFTRQQWQAATGARSLL